MKIRKSLQLALLHNISNIRKFTDNERNYYETTLKNNPDIDIDFYIYEEATVIKDIQETVFGYDDEKFYSVEGQKELHQYFEKSSKTMSQEYIEEISKQNNMFNPEDYFTEEQLQDIHVQQEVHEHLEMQEEIQDLINGVIELTPEYRKVFYETVNYILEEQVDTNKIEKYQIEHTKMLKDLQEQMLQMTQKFMEQNNSNISEKAEEQLVVEQKSHLSVKDFTVKYGKSRETQRQWRARLYNPLPHRKFNGKGRIYYNSEEVEQWMENNS